MKIRWLFLLLLIVVFDSRIVFAQVKDSPIAAQVITSFDLRDQSRKRFGDFEFVGGLVLTSANPDFGALSGLRISNRGQLTAVADTGFWFGGQIERDEDGAPSGISKGKIAPILNNNGVPFKEKWRSDVEGLTIADDGVYVSTEMDMRVLRFSNLGDLFAQSSSRVTPSFDAWPISLNFAFEAIAALPKDHSQYPGLLIIAERDASGGNQAIAFIWKSEKLLPLRVALSDGFSVTDADFLPDGDLLILERRYSPAKGPAMRIKRILGKSIEEGAVLDGKTIVSANSNHVIDNMEGLGVFLDKDGATRVGLVSDDNHWLMQRTLYLEFKLIKQ